VNDAALVSGVQPVECLVHDPSDVPEFQLTFPLNAGEQRLAGEVLEYDPQAFLTIQTGA